MVQLIMYLEDDQGQRLTPDSVVHVQPTLAERGMRDPERNDYVRQASEWAWSLYLIAHGRQWVPMEILDRTQGWPPKAPPVTNIGTSPK